MLRIAIIASAMAGLAASASAQTTESARDVDVSGSVSSLCILGAPSPAAVDLGQLIATAGGRAGRIGAIANQPVTLPGSFCNFGGTVIGLSSTALLSSDVSPPQLGFARAVNFTATVSNWAAGSASVTTAADATGASPTALGQGGVQPTPKVADLSLVLSAFTAPGDALLVSGDYAGAVTITLGPE